jgi:hypothetical protein
MFEGLTKKLGQKNKKKQKYFPECQWQGTRGRGRLPRVLGLGTRGRGFSFFFKRLRLVPPSNAPFLFRVPSSLRVALGEDGLPWVLVFPECHAVLGTRGRPSSPRAILPRVQHSGKIAFPECPIFGSRGSSRHSGNYSSPVVAPASSALSWAERAPSPTADLVITRANIFELQQLLLFDCFIHASSMLRTYGSIGWLCLLEHTTNYGVYIV